MLDDRQQESFMRFWISAQSSVAGYIHSLVRDHAEAKDLLQETALVLFRRFAEYDPERPFLAWALGVARFQILGRRRDRSRGLVVFDDELLEKFTENWTTLSSPDAGERTAVLQECLRELPPRSRHLIRLRYYDGLNSTEIAARTAGHEGSVRVMLQRVRRMLRDCVERKLRLEGGQA